MGPTLIDPELTPKLLIVIAYPIHSCDTEGDSSLETLLVPLYFVEFFRIKDCQV